MATIAPALDVDPQVRRWTREEYYRMGEAGLFQDERVQLIEGEIVTMSPQKWPHSAGLTKALRVLERSLGGQNWVRPGLPLPLSSYSEPEPDISVVEGRFEDYTDHPTTALLIVEVSDATLSFDRTVKSSLYAKAGIRDYWIVNVVDRQLEVHRDPAADPTQRFGYGYRDKSVLGPDEEIAPLADPRAVIKVAEMLP